MRRTKIAICATLALFFPLAASQTWAACTAGNYNNVTATLTPATISSYDPFAGADTTLSLTLIVRNGNTSGNCDASVSFRRAAGIPATLSQSGSTLSYSLEKPGNLTLITQTGFTTNNTPPAANRIDFQNIGAGTSASATLTLRIPAGQISAAGSYGDSIDLELLRLTNANQTNGLVRATPIAVSATVLSKCSLPAPSLSNLNFSSAISNGRPNAGVAQRTTFSNVACTAPTRLRLTGGALQPAAPTPARPGFDNFINYRAAGVFGSASSTLTTTTNTASVDSVQKNIASGATTNGSIAIDVNLVNGNPIIAGTYTGTLTVTIDPSL